MRGQRTRHVPVEGGGLLGHLPEAVVRVLAVVGPGGLAGQDLEPTKRREAALRVRVAELVALLLGAQEGAYVDPVDEVGAAREVYRDLLALDGTVSLQLFSCVSSVSSWAEEPSCQRMPKTESHASPRVFRGQTRRRP